MSQFRDPDAILKPVSKQRKERFKKRMNGFLGRAEEESYNREWNRDTFKQDYEALKNTVEDVEDTISELQDQIAELEGDGKRPHFVDRIKEAYGEDKYEDLRSTDLGDGFYPTLQAEAEKWKELAQLRARVDAWHTYQMELCRIGMYKLFWLMHRTMEAVKTGELAENLQEHVQDELERESNRIQAQLKLEIQEMFSDLQAAVHQGDLSKFNAAPDGDDGRVLWELEDRPLEEKREVLQDMAKYGYNTLEDAAEDADVSQPSISRAVQEVEEEFDEKIDITG